MMNIYLEQECKMKSIVDSNLNIILQNNLNHNVSIKYHYIERRMILGRNKACCEP